MKNSKIEWTDDTWNPIRGCSRVSPGCEHCYAETVAHRFGGPGQPYEGLTVIGANGDPRWNGEIKVIWEHMNDPIKWKKPRRIFVNSMSDLFHEKISKEVIDQILFIVKQCPQHIFQVLTKRPQRMKEHMENFVKYEGILKNLWLGVSIENQKRYDERYPILMETPSIVRWVSFEPLLGHITNLKGLEKAAWVVVGGESGRSARAERGESFVKMQCSKDCPTEMICIHNGKFLTSRTFLHKGRVVSREVLKGTQMECTNCHNFIRGQTDSYFCQYCNLPLCRRIGCLDAHLKPCREERERLMHDTVEIDSHSHFSPSEIHAAQDRARSMAKLKEDVE